MSSALMQFAQKQKATPQSEPLDGQVPNSAGGYSYQVDDMTLLRRFLCLGVEKGTYYIKPMPLAERNCDGVKRLLESGKGLDVVQTIIEYSEQGRVAKQESLLFAFALCARLGDEKTRKAAYEAVGRICRIPTFLFQFVAFCEAVGKNGTGWGRGMRRAISQWYLSKAPAQLAFTITKYRKRHDWSHLDLLRLAHAKLPKDAPIAQQLVFRYIVKDVEALEEYRPKLISPTDAMEEDAPANKTDSADEIEFDFCGISLDDDDDNNNNNNKQGENATTTTTTVGDIVIVSNATAMQKEAQEKKQARGVYKFLNAIQAIQKLEPTEPGHVQEIIRYIGQFRLAREHIPTNFLNSPTVWESLLDHMPMTALLRNLNKMTAIDLLTDGSPHTEKVAKRFYNQEELVRARVHPFNVLVALKTYQSGRGEKGSLQWKPVQKIVEALNKAFHLSFKAVTPTGKRFVLALDVSGSMQSPILGTNSVNCREGSVAMAMVTAAVEPQCELLAFQDKIVPLKGVSPNNTLQDNCSAIDRLSFGGTDCAAPMVYAQRHKIPADVFMVYTDSETWFGSIHPSEALKEYRRSMRIPDARLIVVGMQSNEFTIADPNDPFMLDICGFDSAAPEIIRNFALGLI